MTLPKSKIVLIGRGNVAFHLKKTFEGKGFSVDQVNSRRIGEVPVGDIYVFSVKDDALPEVLKQFPERDGLYVHTAGSLPMNVFQGYAKRYGVLYPLQTFNKEREVNFAEIPLFIEANNGQDEQLLKTIAAVISNKVIVLSSEKRKQLHLAAVFANNFVNHFYNIAADILEEQGLPENLLLPLIEETAKKAKELHPRAAQTGPAVRNDEKTMEMHLAMLESNPRWQQLYDLVSKSIAEENAKS